MLTNIRNICSMRKIKIIQGFFLHIVLLIKDSLQRQIDFNGKILENKCCRCVAYVTGTSNCEWLAVEQGLLSLQQVMVEGGMFLFLLFLHFHSFIPFDIISFDT